MFQHCKPRKYSKKKKYQFRFLIDGRPSNVARHYNILAKEICANCGETMGDHYEMKCTAASMFEHCKPRKYSGKKKYKKGRFLHNSRYGGILAREICANCGETRGQHFGLCCNIEDHSK